MTRIRIDLDRLKESSDNYDLYQIATRASGHKSGVREIDIDGLRIAPTTRFRLSQWEVLPQQPVVQPAVQQEPPKPVEPKPEQIDIDAELKADLGRAADQQRGFNRLQQYVDERGLEPSPENAAAVQAFVDQKVKGYWSFEIVDAAIANLGPRGTNVLRWKPKVAAATPPPAEPNEGLADWQLPLDADVRTMKNASVRGLKELIERRRKATNQQYIRRGHGASF
jgi:hypothetical protein